MRNPQATNAPAAYSGQVQAVIFDWAGTMIDFGSCAPAAVFIEAFRQHGLEISEADARVPMGLPKWDHIKAVLSLPHITALFEKAEGRSFADTDVDRIYETFLPIQTDIIAQHTGPIDGAPELLTALREQGLKVGSTTGYPRSVMEALLPMAEANGIAPDYVVAADDLVMGRPAPLMIYQNMIALGINHPAAIVKADDTVPGILEGQAAGCWTVGLTGSGNEIAMSKAAFDALPADEQAALIAKAKDKMMASGAHYVIDSVADLPDVIADINKRLAAGEQP